MATIIQKRLDEIGRTTADYTVEEGQTINKGQFVRLSSLGSTTIRAATSSDYPYIGLIGIASSSGDGGSTIKVYIP